jgi:hypothetical protein
MFVVRRCNVVPAPAEFGHFPAPEEPDVCSAPLQRRAGSSGAETTDGNPWIVQLLPALLSRLPLHDECSQPIFGSEVPHLIASD